MEQNDLFSGSIINKNARRPILQKTWKKLKYLIDLKRTWKNLINTKDFEINWKKQKAGAELCQAQHSLSYRVFR